MHPASRILVYVLAALVIPGLSFFPLAILLAAALLAIARLHRRPLRLVWRTRWLLLILALGYGYSLPGDALWPPLGEWGPTRQGLGEGAERALHLTTLLLWLDLLVLRLSPERLLAGLHALMRPLRVLGVDGTRIALRLALTLKVIEGLERYRGRGNLRRLFQDEPDSELPERVVLEHYPVRWFDLAVPLLAGLAMLWAAGLGGRA
ncbi:MAG: hypothetical protein AB1831_04570 [Pseudomonadota bacterium]